MIANENIYLEEATQTMYELNADELVQQQCRARRDYYKRINTYNKTLQELEETNKKLELANQEIELLQKRIAELESQ